MLIQLLEIRYRIIVRWMKNCRKIAMNIVTVKEWWKNSYQVQRVEIVSY
jgi:hypothetical protein